MISYPKVSIIIVNWNGLDDTIECLESIKSITYLNYEVIVVDNGSEGNDADILQAKYGNNLTIIRNDKNFGFTGGNNIAIRHALNNFKPDYVLLLNNDTVIAPEFLTEMVRAAEGDFLIGIVGPKTYLYDDPDRLQLVWFDVDMQRGQPHQIGSGEIDRGQYDSTRTVDYIQGSCFLIKRTAIDSIGLLDEAYFAYWEETDYCMRTRKAGYKILYVPLAKIWHKKSDRAVKPWYKTLRSSDQVKIAPQTVYLETLNNFRFMKKYATRQQYCCFLLNVFSYFFWWQCAIFLLYRRNTHLLCSYLRAVIAGLSLKAG